MKHLILITLAGLMFIITIPREQALFGHVAAEKDRREHAEQQFTQQERSNSHLHTAISILSAGVTIALVIGAAVGSKTRRDARWNPFTTKQWRPRPAQPPTVDPYFQRLNGLQRAAECWRYVILRWEHRVSPTGDMREWLRRNSYIGAWLLHLRHVRDALRGPHPVATHGGMAMLTFIVGEPVVLPILVLVAFVVIRTLTASIRG